MGVNFIASFFVYGLMRQRTEWSLAAAAAKLSAQTARTNLQVALCNSLPFLNNN